MEIKDRLKRIQNALGMSQVQMAKEMGVTNGSVNNWIRGRTKPRSRILLEAICRLETRALQAIKESWKGELIEEEPEFKAAREQDR